MGATALLVTWLILSLVGAVATACWSRRLLRRRQELAVRTRIIAVVVATSAIFAMLGALIGLVKAFGAVGGENVDPSQKARILAEGISEAMNCTALGVVVWVPSVIALIFVTRRRGNRSG
jgi:biopolymer transport protein ExbB